MNAILTVQHTEKYKAILELHDRNKRIIRTEVFIGKNGVTQNHVEGDGKTPLGIYKLGTIFGTHSMKKLKIDNYIRINKNLYWVDDIKSKYYNKLVDITNTKKDWTSAEHLIEYPQQYEYAIEIKVNPNNIPGKGSAIFLHCSVEKPTSGCIAIDTKYMKKIIEYVNKNLNSIVIM